MVDSSQRGCHGDNARYMPRAMSVATAGTDGASVQQSNTNMKTDYFVIPKGGDGKSKTKNYPTSGASTDGDGG
jgi:hypothetical protein